MKVKDLSSKVIAKHIYIYEGNKVKLHYEGFLEKDVPVADYDVKFISTSREGSICLWVENNENQG